MIVKNINNVDGFLDAVCNCKGAVELVTGHGDRINLKSGLCRHLELTELFLNPNIGEIHLVMHEPEDIERLTEFLIRG